MNTFIVHATIHTTRGLETVAVNPPGYVTDFAQVCTAQRSNYHACVMSAQNFRHVVGLPDSGTIATHGARVFILVDTMVRL